mgnify:CR=1 FL=1
MIFNTIEGVAVSIPEEYSGKVKALLSAAERRGHAAGVEEGYQIGYQEGLEYGYAEGFNAGTINP